MGAKKFDFAPKTIKIFVTVKAFTESDATQLRFGKSSYRLKKFHTTNSMIQILLRYHTKSFQLNALNDVTSATCSDEYAKKVPFADYRDNKKFQSNIVRLNTF